MTFYALGVNYSQAPVAIREAFASSWEEGRSVYGGVALHAGSELVLLSTCNRTEAYLYGVEEDVRAVQQAFERHAGRAWPQDMSFLHRDEDAIRHIFEVAAGMKSMVPGDVHIYFQLKKAYAVAVEEERVETTMHRLLHTAFRAAKRVINETELSHNNASVPMRAAEVIRSRITRTQGENRKETPASAGVLVVGAGQIGQETAEALQMLGIARLSFTNRTEERARNAAERYRANHVPWKDRHAAAAQADAVIVATSAPNPVLRREAFAMETSGAARLLVDISVPRGVDEAIGALPRVELVTIDQLGKAETRTQDALQASLDKAGEIVDEMIAEYVSWVFLHQSLQPAIQAIAKTFEAIRAQEVDKYRQRFSEDGQEQLDQLTRSIVQKLLAVPVVRLKSVDPERIDFSHGVRLLQHLFLREDCDEEEAPAAENPSRPDAENPAARPADALPADCPMEDMERRAGDVLRMPSRDSDTVRHAF